ncbi:MAG: hypothetical protein M1825_002682 [Sarcosagium campestre]|nr:MAG: hypothetical protein M1825_002682 [Sarcosagium campestre]
MSDANTSTAKSYAEQAGGAIQSGIGSLTGSNSDKIEGENRRAEGEARDDLSHATAKAGPYSLSGSGAVAKDNSERSDGSWNQTVGSAKETVGNLVGADGLKNEGRRQNREGQEQEAAGQLSDLGQGVSDRVTGAVGGAVAGLTGDREAQDRARQTHDEGKTRQRGVEADLQKSQS